MNVQNLIDAIAILNDRHLMLCAGPRPIWLIVLHATQYLEQQLHAELQEGRNG